jgi:heat shock protein HslJ
MGVGRMVAACVLGVAAMGLGACATGQGGGSNAREAIGVTWAQRGEAGARGPRTLLLGPDGRASGFAGVNQYFGTYTLDSDGAFLMKGMGSTKMAGPPEEMRGEQEFLEALQNTTSAKMESGDLVLRGLRVLRFRRAPAE